MRYSMSFLAAIALLSGCVSGEPNTQKIEISSTPSGATCTVEQNSKTVATVNTPAVVSVVLGGHVNVTCTKDGYQNASQTNKLVTIDSWWSNDEAYESPMLLVLAPVSGNMAATPTTTPAAATTNNVSAAEPAKSSSGILGTLKSAIGLGEATPTAATPVNSQLTAVPEAAKAEESTTNAVITVPEAATNATSAATQEVGRAVDGVATSATEAAASVVAPISAPVEEAKQALESNASSSAGDFSIQGSGDLMGQFKANNKGQGNDFFQLPSTILDTQ